MHPSSYRLQVKRFPRKLLAILATSELRKQANTHCRPFSSFLHETFPSLRSCLSVVIKLPVRSSNSKIWNHTRTWAYSRTRWLQPPKERARQKKVSRTLQKHREGNQDINSCEFVKLRGFDVLVLYTNRRQHGVSGASRDPKRFSPNGLPRPPKIQRDWGRWAPRTKTKTPSSAQEAR